MKRTAPLVAALAIAACSGPSSVFESTSRDPVEIDSYVDRGTVVSGQRVTLRVVLDYQSGLDVELRAPSTTLEELPILDYGEEEDRPVPGRTRRTQWYSLEPTRAEVMRLPQFEARYRDAGGVEQVLTTDEVFVNVTASPERDPEKDIRDIWAPTPLAELPWLWILVGALLVLATAVALWLAWLRREPSEKPPLTPEEQIRNELERLGSLDVSTREGARVFCFELTESLRRYLESLCHINASDLTTQELGTAIESTWLALDQRVDFIQVLRAADRVKFAGERADVDELRRLHQIAVRFVDRAHRDPTVEPQERAS